MKKTELVLFVFVLMLMGYFAYKSTAQINKTSLGQQGTTNNILENKSIEEKYAEKNVEQNKIESLKQLEDDSEFKELLAEERKWKELLSTKLNPDQVDYYLKIRTEAEAEKLRDYEEFHRNHLDGEESKAKYKISQDYGPNEFKINQKYEKLLKEFLGDQAFLHYLTLRSQYNENLRSQYKNWRSDKVIDF